VLAILKKALNKVREQKNRSIQSGESNTILPENDDVNQVDEDVLKYLAVMSDGDARVALNALEIALDMESENNTITKNDIKRVLQKSHLHYDRDGEEHYNIISALHKSLRGR
jgi:putative ATPase